MSKGPWEHCRVFGWLTEELKLEAVSEFEDSCAEEDQPEDFKSIVNILHLDESFIR